MTALAEMALSHFGISLDTAQLEQFDWLTSELLTWNTERVNLTAITDPAEVEIRHLLDSLSLLHYIDLPHDCYLADVGTGAGFPGLPLKIARPDLKLTLIESVGKKTAFMTHVVEALDLADVRVVTARAEEAGQQPQYREQFDVVVARALAHMPVLAEYLLPLCKIGGICVAMKGESVQQEIDEASSAFATLGGVAKVIHTVHLPDVEQDHYLVEIEKTAPTPAKYPRRPGMPTKRPLDSLS